MNQAGQTRNSGDVADINHDLVQVGYSVTTDNGKRHAFIALNWDVKASVLAQIAKRFKVDGRIDGDQKKVCMVVSDAPENIIEEITGILAHHGQAIIACDSIAPDRWLAAVAQSGSLGLVSH